MSTASRPHLLHALALSMLAMLGVLGTAPPALATPVPPQLSIHVDDGQTDARSGTTLRYAVAISNLGGTPVRHLAVSQTVPARTRLGSTGQGGRSEKGAVWWRVDVPAGKSVTLRTTVRVGKDLPPELFRLASVACAATSRKAAPTVCASDSDQLPAGAAAAERQRHAQAGAVGGRPGWLLPAGLGLVGLVVIGLVALLATRVLRSRGGRLGRRSAPNA